MDPGICTIARAVRSASELNTKMAPRKKMDQGDKSWLKTLEKEREREMGRNGGAACRRCHPLRRLHQGHRTVRTLGEQHGMRCGMTIVIALVSNGEDDYLMADGFLPLTREGRTEWLTVEEWVYEKL
jgi:hypothetical protein